MSDYGDKDGEHKKMEWSRQNDADLTLEFLFLCFISYQSWQDPDICRKMFGKEKWANTKFYLHDFYIIYLCCYLQKIDCLPSIPTESFTFPGRNSQRLCGKAKGRHTHTTNTMHARLRRTDGQLVQCKPFQIFNTLQLQSMFYDLDGMYQRLIKLVKLVQPSKGESSEMAFVVRIGRLGQTCIATN